MNKTNLSAKNLKALKNGENVKIMLDIDDNLASVVKIVPNKNGTIKVITSLRTKNPNKVVETIKPKQKTITSTDAIEATANSLSRKMISEYQGINSHAKRVPVSTNINEFKKLVESVPGVRDPISYGIRKNGKLLEQSSLNNYVRYFINTIGRMYAKFESRNVPEDKQLQFKAELIEKIFATQNGHGKKTRTKDSIANDVNGRWAAAEEIRKYCEKMLPQIDWGNELAVTRRTKSFEHELTKVIPYEKLVMVATVLVVACHQGVPEAFAACGEVFCGCRVGESCALQMGKFEFKGNVGRYYVDHQIDNNGEITDKLKNDYSYRYIIIHGLMKDIYDLKKQQLLSLGYSENEIGDAFLGSTKENPFNPILKDRVSSFLRKVLLAIGCNKSEIKIIAAIVEGDEGDDCDHDLCAHLFRRIFATLTSNGGIAVNEIDALLGHENKLNKRGDFASWDFAEKMAAMLDRALWFGSLTSTVNPAYEPVALCNDNIIMKGNKQYRFTIEEDGILEGCVESLEANDVIDIAINQEISNEVTVISKTDSETEKRSRVILPFLPNEGTIEKCIAEAKEIEIDEIIKRRK